MTASSYKVAMLECYNVSNNRNCKTNDQGRRKKLPQGKGMNFIQTVSEISAILSTLWRLLTVVGNG